MEESLGKTKNAHSHLLILLFLSVILASCTYFPTTIPVTQTQIENSEIQIHVYFSDPGKYLSTGYDGGPDEMLAQAINTARLSVDIAAYDFNLWSIRDALLGAKKRGVIVRMVMESDNVDTVEVQELKDAGITIIGDQQEGLMHDKFVIIDRENVWTGSMNFTVGGAYRDNNNLLDISSAPIARLFSDEFEQMFVDNLFGRYKTLISQASTVDDPQYAVSVYFSPEADIENTIIELINNAKKSIDFMLFSFTLDDIGTALIEKAKDGIVIRGVMDSGQYKSNQGTEFDRLKENGINIRLDGNDGLMHNKVLIIDDAIVLTGSYNFSYNAETNNDENVVIIQNTDLATSFTNEFEKIFTQAIP